MAKFTYDIFQDECDTIIGFNAEKYTKEQALATSMVEFDVNSVEELNIIEAYIWHGFGEDFEGDKRNCYWIGQEPQGHSFKAWSVTRK